MKRSPAAMLLALLASSMPMALGSMVRRVTSSGFGHEAAELHAEEEPVRTRFVRSRSQIAFLAEEALLGVERESNTWALYGGIGVGVLACIGGTAFAMAGTKSSSEKEEAREVCVGSQVISAEAAKNADMDAEKLVKTVAKRAVQMVGPKLAKANMVKGILEQHVYGFPLKAQAFLASEMYTTVGAVLKEMEAEEAMVMFGMGSDGSISVPPMSVLLAGLLSPVILSVSFFIHLLQVIVVLIPVACLAGWAIWHDQTAGTLMSCAVPGMWIWIYAIGILATILAIAHCISMASIASGKAQIQQKAEEMKDEILEAVGDGELTVEECRKIFLVSSVLLEHALMVEDNLRRSIWRNVIGLGTIAWFLLTIWNFWIVLIYTFVPGVVAFHPSAKEVAGDDYCGAWATVFTARLTCVLALLFVVFNMISMLQYISDQLVTSEGYFAGILSQAKKFDQSSIGVPVMQTMVKAFLLRGNGDTLASHIAHANNQQAALEAERDRLQAVKESLEGRIEEHKAEANQLRKEMGLEEVIEAPKGPSIADKASAAAMEASQMAEDAVADAKARAAELEKVTREELENLIKKIMDAAEQVRNSEAVRQAIEQAEKAKEQAEQAAAMAQDPEVRARLLAEAQEAAERAAEAGMKQAEELKKQAAELAEQGMEKAEELKAQAEELVEKGKEEIEKIANSEEVQAAVKAGKEVADKAVEKGKEVVEKGKEAAEAAANSPEAQKAMAEAEKAVKEGKKAAEKASKEVSAAASQASKDAASAAKQMKK